MMRCIRFTKSGRPAALAYRNSCRRFRFRHQPRILRTRIQTPWYMESKQQMAKVSAFAHWTELSFLPLKAVQIRPLDGAGNVIPAGKKGVRTASGALRREPDGLYLYTCWHVITAGIDPHDATIPSPGAWIRPESLRAQLQGADDATEGVVRIGGNQSFDVPLYRPDSGAPAWAQDKHEVPNEELNRAGFRLPKFYDVIKIRIPDIQVTDLQSIDSIEVFSNTLVPGDKVYVVGFPYGYSSVGNEQPSAIVMTRFIAAVHTSKPMGIFLLDASAAPCMSGGPVFLERDSALYSIGIYTGEIYPEQGESPGRKDTALGTCAPMMLPWLHPEQLGLVVPPQITADAPQ
jgi:hypothetical protein